MRYYVHTTDLGPGIIFPTVWAILPTEARKIHGAGAQKSFQPPSPGQDVLAALRQAYPKGTFVPLELEPGASYPRMARTTILGPELVNPQARGMLEVVRTFQGQLEALTDQLERIFRVAHPASENLSVYGHEIRNLLILAATEAEAAWKGVLIANNAKAKNTHDYVRLTEALKLDEYEIFLPSYPSIQKFRPFANWRPCNSPTRALPWYDAYNSVKHDRESSFERGTLQHAISAIGGCFVMGVAQFGEKIWGESSQLSYYFRIVTRPSWPHHQRYFSLLGSPDRPGSQPAYPF